MEREKQVDESWKNAAAAEKDVLKGADSPETKKDAKIIVDDFVKDSGASEQESTAEASVESASESGSESEMEINFLNYVTSLGFQAMIFLGEIPHPSSQKIEKNVDQAKFIIDTLVMLREKTKGNLDSQEDNLLNASVYELQMKYVEVLKADKA